MADTCILILEEMQKTSWVAQSFAKILKWALERVLASETHGSAALPGNLQSVEAGTGDTYSARNTLLPLHPEQFMGQFFTSGDVLTFGGLF
jgi:hypothetical protein